MTEAAKRPTTAAILATLSACSPGAEYVSGCATAREAWDQCTDRRHMMWILDAPVGGEA